MECADYFIPFDPAKPAANTPTASAEMRAQLIALNADIQTRATQAALSAGINTAINAAINGTLPQTSSNTNGVSILGQTADGGYNPGQMQMLFDKLDELITLLRRA